MDQTFVKDRLRLLLDHFSVVGDPRKACKVKYPLPEVLFLVTCATIAGCDDYDEIADWGGDHQNFLKGYGEYFFGTPAAHQAFPGLPRIHPRLVSVGERRQLMASRGSGASTGRIDVKCRTTPLLPRGDRHCCRVHLRLRGRGRRPLQRRLHPARRKRRRDPTFRQAGIAISMDGKRSWRDNVSSNGSGGRSNTQRSTLYTATPKESGFCFSRAR